MFTIHQGKHITTLVDGRDQIRYTVESMPVLGWWVSSIRSVAQSRSSTGDAPDFWYDEVARVEWCGPETLVFFGSRGVNANSYLRRENRFANSRIFIGPEGEDFRWKIKGGGLELHHDPSGTLVASSHSSHRGSNIFSVKPRVASLDVVNEYSRIPQMLDKIVITWAILDGVIHNKDLQVKAAYY